MAEKRVFSLATKVKLEEELRFLKNEGLKERVENLQTARGFGDLSENYEYKVAREEMNKAEARIQEIEIILSSVEIYEKKKNSSKVELGSVVTIQDVDTNVKKTYEIVGDFEADLNATPIRICYTSPLGKILLGAKKGSEVDYVHNGKEVTYEITDIE